MPSYRNLAFSCEESGIAGFASSSLTMNCTVFIADRNSQRMPRQQVTFLAEAGAIDRFATTDALGSAVAVYRATAPGPMDVAAMAPGTARATSPITWTSRYAGVRPSGYDGVIAQPWYGGGVDTVQNGELNGEPSRLGVCGSGANGTCNPRDGLVSLIAIVSGEEQWDDLNRNGQWDPGEDFLDLPEPFIDVNDDGKYDMAIEGENYVDVNQNGKWDGPNGKWDAATRIWKTAKVVWTGDPSSSVFATDTRSPPLPVPSPLTVPHCSNPVGVVLVVADANLNFPANAAGDVVDCRTSSGLASAKPTGYAVLDGHHGRKDILVSVSDNHVCSPDCLRVTVPCSGGPDSLQCTGSFRSIGGFTATLGSAGPTVSLDVK